MLFDTLIKYSSLFKKTIDKTDFKVFLESSPQYPNLLSVIQTLQYAHLDSQVGQCDWDYLKNIESPFLLHVFLKSKETLIISKWDAKSNCLKALNPKHNTWENVNKDKLMYIWDGVVIYTNAQTLNNYCSKDKIKILLLVISVAAFTHTIMKYWNIHLLHILPIFIGFVASLCTYWRRDISEIGFIEKICKKTSLTDCDTVENSYYGVWRGLSMTNMALSFFISQLICIIVSFVFKLNSILHTEYLFSLIILVPLVIYSSYVQIKVRKICPLCIMILMCVFSEAFLFVCFPTHSVNIGLFVVFGIIYIGILCILRFIDLNHLILQEKTNTTIQLLKLKRKTEVILLESFQIEPIITPMWFGDENSSINITTIISPSCKHCRKVSFEIFLLIKKGVKFRWNIVLGKRNSHDSEEIAIWVQEYISDKILFFEKLHLWSNMQIQSLRNDHGNVDCYYKISKISSDFDKLLERLNIHKFPQLILNNRLLSPIYNIIDLEFIITDMATENNDVKIEK